MYDLIVILFETSASVIAILFAIWGFIQTIREQRTYLPKRAEIFALISFLVLVAICLISLWFLTIQPLWSESPNILTALTFFLSSLFTLAIILMGISFTELIKRV